MRLLRARADALEKQGDGDVELARKRFGEFLRLIIAAFREAGWVKRDRHENAPCRLAPSEPDVLPAKFRDHEVGKERGKRPLALVFEAVNERLHARVVIRKWRERSAKPLRITCKGSARARRAERRAIPLAPAALKGEEKIEKRRKHDRVLKTNKRPVSDASCIVPARSILSTQLHLFAFQL